MTTTHALGMIMPASPSIQINPNAHPRCMPTFRIPAPPTTPAPCPKANNIPSTTISETASSVTSSISTSLSSSPSTDSLKSNDSCHDNDLNLNLNLDHHHNLDLDLDLDQTQSQSQEQDVPPPIRKTEAAPKQRVVEGYINRVGFDSLDCCDSFEYSCTLQAKTEHWRRTKQTRTFLVGADVNDYSARALGWVMESMIEDGDE
ncbi:hypothetical protein BGZ94_008861, partial [Podila epigama]